MEPVSALTLGVDHVGLTVSDLESSVRFFCECLGWKVIGGVPSYPATFVSDGVTRLTLWQVDLSGDAVAFDRRRNIGLHHLAFKIADLPTLHEVFTRVSSWPGVEVEFAPQSVGQGPRVHCMLREPGGVRLELVCTPAG
jgi:lactoylglutathione lyase